MKFFKKLKNRKFLKAPLLLAFIVILISAQVVGSLSVFAASDTMPFDLWSRYNATISFVKYDGSSFGNTQTVSVVNSDSSLTTFRNDNIFPDDWGYPYFKRVSLGTPVGTSILQPAYTVNSIFLNRPVSTVCTVRISSGNDYSLINDINVSDAYGFLYTSSGSSPSQLVGDTEILSTKILSSKMFEVSFMCTFEFTEVTNICGFWFALDGVFDYNVANNPPENTLFSFESYFSLSPLVFTDELTKEEIETIVQNSTADIVENQNNNTQSIIDNQDNNTQSIIDNQDNNAESIIQSGHDDALSIIVNQNSNAEDIKSNQDKNTDRIIDEFGSEYTAPDSVLSDTAAGKEEELLYHSSSLLNNSNLDFKLSLNDFQELGSTMQGFSLLFTKKFTQFSFIPALFMFVLGFGGFSFLFGLAQHVILGADRHERNVARTAKRSAKRSYRGN